MMKLRLHSGAGVSLGLVTWMLVVIGASGWLMSYAHLPGAVASAPSTLPSVLAEGSKPGQPHLVLVLHPKCPCSRATVEELTRILARTEDGTALTALFYRPEKESDAWIEGSLADQCRRLNARIVPDPEGRLAAAVGGLTSGHVVVYDAAGSLAYEGGITRERGHEGDNEGKRSVLQILRGSAVSRRTGPVFGCPLT